MLGNLALTFAQICGVDGWREDKEKESGEL